jgi:hypothetical protein
VCWWLCTLPHIRAFRFESMSNYDRQPLANAPMAIQIVANNRLGAIYSALYSFWTARHAATTASNRQSVGAQRDAYSVILFNHKATQVLTNDFKSSPDQLLDAVLLYGAEGRRNVLKALITGQAVMAQNWSMERFVSFSLTGSCIKPLF